MAGEDKPAQRKSDSNDGGGSITTTDGNSTVYANNLLVSVNGSIGTGHGPGPHVGGAWQTTSGSGTVFAHGVEVNFTGNPDTCGHARVGGSGDVFVGDSVDQDTVPNRAMNEIDEEDAVNPGGGAALISSAATSGAVSTRELAAGKTPVIGARDTSLPSATAKILSTDCADIHALFPNEQTPNIVPPSGNAIDSIPLSARYTVAGMTRKPNVIFDHALRGPSSGLTLEQILCNLKMLAINVVEPIRAHYPQAFLTNTWRPEGIGSPTSQHPKGMAVDLQFKTAAKKDYFAIAQWIRDNVVFDQLLLEYKTTGSGLPWIHVSFNKAGNRKQVLTLLNDHTYGPGLIDLSQTE